MTKEDIIEDLDVIIDDILRGDDNIEVITKAIRNVRYNINEYLIDDKYAQGEQDGTREK